MATCACGCGGSVTRFRYVRGHNSVPRKGYTVDSHGCWLWNGHVRSSGYPASSWANGRAVDAHRAAFIKANGPIPEGLQLDHLCRNRKCVNPSHLQLVTPAENVRRKPGSKYSPDARRRIFALREGGMTHAAIAESEALSKPMVTRILSGKRWAEA